MPKNVKCTLPSGAEISVSPDIKVEIDDLELDREHWEEQFWKLMAIADDLASESKSKHNRAVRNLATMVEEMNGEDLAA